MERPVRYFYYKPAHVANHNHDSYSAEDTVIPSPDPNKPYFVPAGTP